MPHTASTRPAANLCFPRFSPRPLVLTTPPPSHEASAHAAPSAQNTSSPLPLTHPRTPSGSCPGLPQPSSSLTNSVSACNDTGGDVTPAGCPLGGPCPAGAREGPAGRRRSAERSALHCVHAHCPLGLGHPSSQAGSGPLLGSLSRPLLVLTIHRQIHLPQWTGSPRRAGPRMSWALIGPQRHPAQGERRGEAQGRHLVNEGPPSPPPVLRILRSRNA